MNYMHWQGAGRPVAEDGAVSCLTLPSNEDAPRAARAAVAPFCADVSEDVLERAVLLVTEVVTNAVKYSGRPEVRLDIWHGHGAVAVVVSDDGPGFDAAASGGSSRDGSGGLGLPLLDRLSEAWGSGRGEDSWVWFEVSPRLFARPGRIGSAALDGGGDPDPDLRMVVDSVTTHALIALDSKGTVTEWGAAAASLTGYSAEEALGTAFADFYVPPSAGELARDRAAAEWHGSHRVERQIRRKDGSHIWVEIDFARMREDGGPKRGVSALFSEVTERRSELPHER